MCVGPGDHRSQTRAQREAGGFEVDVLHVQHLEARFVQVGDARLRRQADERGADPPRVQAALRVGEHVELDLPHALRVELLIERKMLVVECDAGLWYRGRQRREERLPRPQVVAVVRANHLDLVERQALVKALALALDHAAQGRAQELEARLGGVGQRLLHAGQLAEAVRSAAAAGQRAAQVVGARIGRGGARGCE